jgi:hypothetical protein
MNLSSDVIPEFFHTPLLPSSQTSQLTIFLPHIFCKRTAKSQYMSNHFMSFHLHKRHKLILVFQFGAHFHLYKLLLITTCCSCLSSLPESFRIHRTFLHKSAVSTEAAAFQQLSLCSQLCYEVSSPQYSFFKAQILKNLCASYL